MSNVLANVLIPQ